MAVLPLASSALAPMLLRRPPLRSGLAARPRLSRSTHRPGLFLGRPTSVTVYARGGGSGRGRDGGRSPSPSGRGGRGGPSGPPPPRWGTPLDIFGRLNLKTQPKTVRGGVAAQEPCDSSVPCVLVRDSTCMCLAMRAAGQLPTRGAPGSRQGWHPHHCPDQFVQIGRECGGTRSPVQR